MESTKIRKERRESPHFCLHNRLPRLAKFTKGQRQQVKKERRRKICTLRVCVCVWLLPRTDISFFESQERKKTPTTRYKHNFRRPQTQNKLPFLPHFQWLIHCRSLNPSSVFPNILCVPKYQLSAQTDTTVTFHMHTGEIYCVLRRNDAGWLVCIILAHSSALKTFASYVTCGCRAKRPDGKACTKWTCSLSLLSRV